MKKAISITILSICISMFLNSVFAQNSTSIADSIYSEILQEQRSIKINLPVGYDPESEKEYEVIYLTDREWAENLFTYIYKFAQDENYVPEVIIVAVRNKYIDGANQRDRDLLPVHVPQPAISGGADKFLSFFKNELMPYIDKTYKTNGKNSLYGHSYGGTFVAYALLSAPDLFESYYSTDPALSYNDNYIIKLAAERIESLPPGKMLWMAGITETYKRMKINLMDSVLQKKAPENLRWKVVTYPNEKHNSVRLKAMYDGIKFSYSDYSNEKKD